MERGDYKGKEYVKGELYINTLQSGTGTTFGPAPWVVYLLHDIEVVVLGASPEQRFRFHFYPVLDLWSASIIADDPRRYTTAEPRGWVAVRLLDLATARMRLDHFILEEAKRKGMK
jgi:hypothetical protein